MKKLLYSIALMMVTVFSSVLLTACGDPEPTKLEIVETSIETTTLVNQTHDLSGLKVVVTYDNGDTKTVDKNNDMTITPINVNQLGEQTLTVKYLGLTASLKVKVVSNESDLYKILGFDKPTFQTDWEFARLQHSDNAATTKFDESELTFANRTQSYKVGDENPFVYLPIITAVDDEGNDVEFGEGTNYTSKVKVELKEGSTYTELTGTALTNMVAVDNTKSSFDFEQAAVNKTFKITVEPENNPYEVAPLSIEVEVVDGWNAHTVADLSRIDNNTKAVDDWAEYKAANGITQNAQDGIVLHGNMVLSVNDIPKSYVYNYDANGANVDGATAENNGSLKVKKSIYCRDTQSPFAIYGNYFTVDASHLPLTKEFGSEDFGHTYIFAFGGDDNEYPGTKQKAGKVESLYMIGNASKDDSEDLKGGINGIISSSENLVIDNCISRAFLTHVNTVDAIASTTNPEVNYAVKTTIKNSHMYDSYSMMVFAWGDVEVEVDTCEFKRAGGPTIMATQVVERHNTVENDPTTEVVDEIRSGNVVIKNTVTESYLAGTEGWFDLTPGAAQAVESITALSGGLAQFSTALQKQSLPVTPKQLTTNDGGLQKLNLISLLLSNADNPVASAYGLTGEITIKDGEEVKCFNDPQGKMASIFEAVPQLKAMPFLEATGTDIMGEPLSAIIAFNGSTFQVLKNGALVDASADVANELAAFFSADYVNLYMNGTGLSATLQMYPVAIPQQ